jgi:CRP/FNR family transcriptional regulator, anaerobic regulatory protein
MIMPTRILKSISTFLTLIHEEEDALMNIVEHKELKKDELILQEGQVCDFVIFIVSGCLKYFYQKDGENEITHFFTENDWYTDYESFLTGDSSTDNVQVMENTRCLIIKKTKLEKLYVDYPAFERLGRVMAEQALLGAKRCNKVSNILSTDEYYLAVEKMD